MRARQTSPSLRDEVPRKNKRLKTNVALLMVALAASLTPKIAAQSPGTFTPTGNMTRARFFHTATLLADGRVLIAGGDTRDASGFFKTQADAELYDPRTGKFTATGNMITSRRWHAATLLPDGRVLIAGGAHTISNAGAPPTALASAELYDPRTGTFSSTGEMSTPRFATTVTLLNSGKVLLAGYPGGAELFDPGTGTFTPTGSMIGEWADTATLLPNGKVLITRGNPQTGPYLSSAELYDPSSGTFSSAGYARANHTAPTATLIMNGKVLIAGGDMGDGDGGTFIAEHYDPATGTFSKTGDMTIGREQHTATLLTDGTVLFAGGHLWLDLAATAEIYDPIKGAFTRTANMPTAHELHTATLLADGTVLIAGGFMPWPFITSNAEIYHPAALIPPPQLLSVSGNGGGQGAILHGNSSQVASSDSPAAVGEALEIYLTGLGDGNLIPPQVSIGGRMAEVLWFGNTHGHEGLNQINVRVPAGVTPGPSVPVRLTYIGRPSNEVNIGVR